MSEQESYLNPSSSYLKKALVIVTFGVCTKSYASFPVIDFHAIASMMKQLKQMKQDYLTLKNIKKTSEQGFNNLGGMLSGHYSFGEMGNDVNAMSERYASAENWGSWHSLESPKNQMMKKWSNEYDENHTLWANQEWVKKVPDEELASIRRELSESRAESIDAVYNYDQSEKRRKFVGELSKSIDETESTKAAIDLNSRLSVESEYLQTESLKQMALINRHLAEESYQQLLARSEEARFTSMPNEKDEIQDDGVSEGDLG